MKNMFLAIFIFSRIGLAADMPLPASTQTSESIIADYEKVSVCTERIWPGFSWAGHTMLAYDKTQKMQLAFDVDSKSKFKVDLDQLPGAEGASATFSFFDAQNKKWISVNRDYGMYSPKPHGTFALGVHESFHHIAQSNNRNWVWRDGARGDEIPIRWEPRFYRASIEEELRKALANPADQVQYLQAAKYWYERWKTEFPAENLSTTDGYEGSAMYAELIGEALAETDCAVSEEKMRSIIAAKIATNLSLMSSNGGGGADSEGYPIGSVAALILRFDQRMSGWESFVVAGETPLDILLKNVTSSAPVKLDPKKTEGFIATANRSQQDVDRVLKSTQAILGGRNSIRLAIPYKWKPGSTGYQGFYIDAKNNQRFSVVSEPFNLQIDGNKIVSQEEMVSVDSGIKGQCSEYGWTIVLAADQVKVSGDRILISGEKVKGDVKAKLKTDASGTGWICLGE